MRVSIVIPTLNRCELLKETLLSLGNVDGIRCSEECEVVVIDNGSKDSTRPVCEESRGLIPSLRYISDPTPGLHVGRNRGWMETTGDVVAYLDDDVLLEKGWLGGIRAAFEAQDVWLVGGPVQPLFKDAAPDWLLELWNRQPQGEKVLGELSIIDFGTERRRISTHHVFGCNFSVRRSTLELAKGFHPDGMPKPLLRFRGDGESYISEIINQKGGSALYHPLVAVRHQVTQERMTHEYFRRRWYAQGISDSYTDLRGNYGLGARIRRQLGIFKHLAHSHFGSKKVSPMQQEFRRSWAQGYWFHQLEALRDPKLREWIRRKDYLGAKGQIPS